MPTCPACQRRLGWSDSFSFWNPWRFPCPGCKTELEASPIQKRIAVASVPLGAALALAAIYLERIFGWRTFQVLAFFVVAVVLLLAGALASWPRTTFTLRKKGAPT